MIIDFASMLQDISGTNTALYNIITGGITASTVNTSNNEDSGESQPGDDKTISQLSDKKSDQEERQPPLFEQFPNYTYIEGEPEPILKNHDESETIALMTVKDGYIVTDKDENDGKKGPTEGVDNNNI